MPKSGVSIEIDHFNGASPHSISAEELKDIILSDSRDKIKVIDLRSAEEFHKKHIADSINIPFSDLQPDTLRADFHSGAQEGRQPRLVFASSQSPDIDDFAARQWIEGYQQAYGVLPPSDSVCILLGGISNWVSLFEKYPSLVQEN